MRYLQILTLIGLMFLSVCFAENIEQNPKLKTFNDFKVCYPGEPVALYYVESVMGSLPTYKCMYENKYWLELRNTEDTKTLHIFLPEKN